MPTPVGLPRRTVAFLFDQFVVLCLGVLPALAAGVSVDALVTPGETRRNVFLLLCGIAFVYHLTLEWVSDQTPGKYLLGIKVVTDSGDSIGLRESFLRNALRAIDGLGYWSIAVAVILLRGDGKRLGDIAGHTVVVSTADPP
jgi:uncharacterized RDD family membrane protein YckC